MIDPADLRVETLSFHPAVRMIHIPTGITVEVNESKSQYQNRQSAKELLIEKVKAMS